jgi:cytochrome c556
MAQVRDYNRFEHFAQAIWASGDFQEKKELILEVISKFEFKKKTDKFVDMVNKLTDSAVGRQKLDKLVADLVLIQSGDKVIR